MSQYKIFFDTSENMKKHKVKDVKLMITSPPYWDLKDYEAENQIGYNEDYDTYLNRLYKVWKNTFDVMQKDGVAIININTKSFKSSLKLLPNDFIKQMQKIGFARIIISKPDIILLDESTSNLDEESKKIVFNKLKENNTTIINSTHDPENFNFADHHLQIQVQDEKRVIKNIF